MNSAALLSKFESVKIYWLSVKFYWFKRGYCKSVKFHWLFQWKLTDLTVKNMFFTDSSVKINWFNSEKYFFTDESVKRQITDSISENLTDSDLESGLTLSIIYSLNLLKLLIIIKIFLYYYEYSRQNRHVSVNYDSFPEISRRYFNLLKNLITGL